MSMLEILEIIIKFVSNCFHPTLSAKAILWYEVFGANCVWKMDRIVMIALYSVDQVLPENTKPLWRTLDNVF